MSRASNHPESLCICTDDPALATTGPVVRPRPGGRPVAWFSGTKTRFYRPFLVRVLEIDDTTMTFVFLDTRTGEDLTLSQPAFTIAYHDGRYAYSDLPSTATKVRPGDEASCGVLFLTDAFVETLRLEDRTALFGSTQINPKWPMHMAGHHHLTAPPRARTRTATDLAPGEDEEDAETNPLVEEIDLDESVG